MYLIITEVTYLYLISRPIFDVFDFNTSQIHILYDNWKLPKVTSNCDSRKPA